MLSRRKFLKCTIPFVAVTVAKPAALFAKAPKKDKVILDKPQPLKGVSVSGNDLMQGYEKSLRFNEMNDITAKTWSRDLHKLLQQESLFIKHSEKGNKWKPDTLNQQR